MASTVRKLTAVAAVGGVVLGSLALAPGAVGAPGDNKSMYVVETAAGSSNADAESALVAGGGSIKARWTYALQGFAVELPDSAVPGLSRNPHIGSITPDIEVSIAETQSNPPSWGLDRLDQVSLPLSKSYTFSNNGGGQKVYVIDTGIDFTHPDFAGRAVSGYDFIDNDDDAADCHGHGTHVAGTVGGATFGVAKGVQLVAVRVLNCQGSGSASQVISGINYVASQASPNAPVVANMSLGGGYYAPENTAVENAVKAGVVMAVAAGNSNANACNSSPASAVSALTVGATTSTDARASYSNYGSCLDLFAPGSAITSSTKGGGSATWNGTSMATPHAAGVAARYLQAHPGTSAADVTAAVVAAATGGKVTGAGTGSPNKLLNSQFLDADAPPAPGPLMIATTALPSGQVEQAYSATVSATGGTAPLTWSANGLPSGLSMNAGTGVIAGTPTASGTTTVSITVADSAAQSTSRQFTLTIASAPSVSQPGAPASVTATSSRGKTQVKWAAPTNNGGAAVMSYEVAFAKAGAAEPVSGTNVGLVTTANFRGLTKGAQYRAYVRAVNSAGAGDWGVSATFTAAVK